MRSLLIFLFISTLTSVGWGQLVTNASDTPTQLVENYLKNAGDSILNVSYSGSTSAKGRFTAANTNLGLDDGIILTTGTILNSSGGPHGPNNQEGAGLTNGAGSCPELSLLLAGLSTFDAAILEYDIIPANSGLVFEYVFGSEEYLEYVNTGFPDACMITVSGPGLPEVNIARTPNDMLISVDNIHSAGTNVNGTNYNSVYGELYVNNFNGSTIQYDGFTVPMQASIDVQPGLQYHVKIAIADVGDQVWDSGLFFRNCSAPCVTGIDDIESEMHPTWFPNPSNGNVQIELPNHSEYLVEVFQLSGAKVKTVRVSSSELFMRIDGLDEGVYLFSVTGDTDQWIEKVIITK